MGVTKIEWCDYTFNPWRGCQKVNAGCTNCYADKNARRMPDKFGVFGSQAQGGTRVVAAESMWREPVKWNALAEIWIKNEGRRPRVFCASLADVFEAWDGPMLDHNGHQLFTINGDEWFTEAEYPECRPLTMNDCRQRLFKLIDATPNLDWLVLSKRPENVRRMWPHLDDGAGYMVPNKIENVWLGTSVANQETAEQAIPELLKCRDLAKVLFLSCEPLIGPVDLSSRIGRNLLPSEHGLSNWPQDGIDWVIVGGESGPKARPCDTGWILDVIVQCKSAGVPCFVKQIGANVIDSPSVRKWPHVKDKLHPKGGDINEWPASLRVREFPQ